MKRAKPGDLVKVTDLWNPKDPKVLGIVVFCETYLRRGANRCKLVLPDGKLAWRYEYELELIG